MKIVVTGGLGHIGSKLIRYLPKAFPRSHIVIIDNLLTQRYSSLFNLPNMGRFEFIEKDIVKYDVQHVLQNSSVVIHLAAITDATKSFENALEFENNNFQATKIIADICAEENIPLLSFSSTSVYGTQKKIVDENCTISDLNPQSPYAEIKLKEEKYLWNIYKEKDLRFLSLRFGTIFGTSPGMRFHTAVNKFCWQAVSGTPLTVWKTALNQRRPYLDLEDAVKAIEFFIKRNIFNGEIFNVVTCNATVKEIIDSIRENIDPLEIKYVESKIMNQLSYNVSNKKLLSIGFKFKGNLKKGIYETIKLIENFNFNNKCCFNENSQK